MKYVKEEIAETYKETQDNEGWLDIPEYISDGYGGGNCIFISSPTGSGKTHFILNVWLEYIANKNKKMLYLVNRSILKEQLNQELEDKCVKLFSCIDVKLYQDIEHELKMYENVTDEQRKYNNESPSLEKLKEKYSKYDCVVCDECHYFLTDANYNTDTALSFRWIQDCFADKVRIFMSATIEDIKLYIKAYDKCRAEDKKGQKYYLPDFEPEKPKNAILKGIYKNNRSSGFSRECEYYNYEILIDYDYIDANIVHSTDTIAEIINDEDKTEKWLIFVDSIETGKKLSQKIKDKNNVVFVSSKNKHEDDVSETLNEIKYDEKIKLKRIVITTSVMDNGINIKDVKLRNIVLMADTKTEFIQMLGRKREDGKKLKLYIYQYDKTHFEQRLKQTYQVLRIANSYLKYLDSCKKEYGSQYKEELVIEHRHIKLMREMFDNKISTRYVHSLFNVYGGRLYLNLLAYQNLKNLIDHYKDVIAAFNAEEDDAKRDYCFVKMQLGWIGIEEEKADNIIEETKISKVDRCYQKVMDAFEKMCNTPMTVDEAKKFQDTIRSELAVLVEATKDIVKDMNRYCTTLAQAEKSKCLISKRTMEYLYQYCKIPYKMMVEGKKENRRYTIRKEGWQPGLQEQDRSTKEAKSP